MLMRSLAYVAGFCTGAGLMYLLDPVAGPGRRARTRDRARRQARKMRVLMKMTARDARKRTKGLASRARRRLRPRPADDDILVARIRAEMGHVVSHPRAIEVACHDGRCTLKGPILEHEVKALLKAVGRVDGVKDVENHLEAHPEAGPISSLQGDGVRRHGMRMNPTRWAVAAMGLGGALAAAAARGMSHGSEAPEAAPGGLYLTQVP